MSSKQRIDDFGAKIGGARKDFSFKLPTVEEVRDMSQLERTKHICKNAIWTTPDYEQMVNDGMEREVAFLVKEIRDAVTPKIGPRELREAGYRGVSEDDLFTKYAEMVASVRDALANVKNREALEKACQEYEGAWSDNWEASGIRFLGVDARKTMRNLSEGTEYSRNWYFNAAKSKAEKKGWPFTNTAEARTLHKINFQAIVDADAPEGKNVKIRRAARGALSTQERLWCDELAVMEFGDPDEAMAYARSFIADKVKEERENGRNVEEIEVRPMLENIERTGTDHREGRNVTEEELQTTFGFRGGEFGNWLTQEDRQQSLNHAYDALSDLAGVLGVPRTAISLDGKLAIAFGSRGNGGRARAHYEPGRRVFNLTKPKGAGCVAHEWFHALDHALGEISGIAQANPLNPYLSENTMAPLRNLNPTEERFKAVNGMRNLLRVMHGVQQKVPLTVDETKDVAHKKLAGINRSIASWLRRHTVSEQEGRWFIKQEGGNPVEMSAEDAAKWAEWKSSLSEGFGLHTEWDSMDLMARRYLGKNGGFSAKANDGNRNNNLVIKQRVVAEIRNAEQGGVASGTRDTDYWKTIKALDEARSKPYWTEQCEVAARAFESFVQDEIQGRGLRSDYLVHGTEAGTKASRIYPQDELREKVSEHWRGFCQDLQTILGSAKEIEERAADVKAYAERKAVEKALGEAIRDEVLKEESVISVLRNVSDAREQRAVINDTTAKVVERLAVDEAFHAKFSKEAWDAVHWRPELAAFIMNYAKANPNALGDVQKPDGAGNVSSEKETPLQRDYRQLKEQAPDSVVGVRLGDFIEFFNDDAVKVAKGLTIALTRRQNVPMCGIPYHSVDRYLALLNEAGISFAIAEKSDNGKEWEFTHRSAAAVEPEKEQTEDASLTINGDEQDISQVVAEIGNESLVRVNFKDGTSIEGRMNRAQGNPFVMGDGEVISLMAGAPDCEKIESVDFIQSAEEILAQRDSRKYGEPVLTNDPQTRDEIEASLWELSMEVNRLGALKHTIGDESFARQMQVEAQFNRLADRVDLAKKKRRYMLSWPAVRAHFNGADMPRPIDIMANEGPMAAQELEPPKPSDFHPDPVERNKRSQKPLASLPTLQEIQGSLDSARRELAKPGRRKERREQLSRIIGKRLRQLTNREYIEARKEDEAAQAANVQLTDDAFIDQFKPEVAEDGSYYRQRELYNPEDRAVIERAEKEHRLWTMVEDDNGNPVIVSGFHVVNQLYYVITEVPHVPNQAVTVLDDEAVEAMEAARKEEQKANKKDEAKLDELFGKRPRFSDDMTESNAVHAALRSVGAASEILALREQGASDKDLLAFIDRSFSGRVAIIQDGQVIGIQRGREVEGRKRIQMEIGLGRDSKTIVDLAMVEFARATFGIDQPKQDRTEAETPAVPAQESDYDRRLREEAEERERIREQERPAREAADAELNRLVGPRPWPSGKDATPANAVHAAMRAVEGSGKRIMDLRASGATDDELRAFIGNEFGIFGGMGDANCFGGQNPRLEVGRGERKITIKGKELVALARKVFEIGAPKQEQKTEQKQTQPELDLTQPEVALYSEPEGKWSLYQMERHDGLKWMVQAGEKRGFGDWIFDDEDKARGYLKLEQRREQDREETLRKLAEEEAKEKERQQELRDFDGFEESKSPMQLGRMVKALSEKQVNYQGELISVRNLIRNLVAEGRTIDAEDGERRLAKGDIYMGEDKITKMGMDYAAFLIEKAEKTATEIQPAREEEPAKKNEATPEATLFSEPEGHLSVYQMERHDGVKWMVQDGVKRGFLYWVCDTEEAARGQVESEKRREIERGEREAKGQATRDAAQNRGGAINRSRNGGNLLLFPTPIKTPIGEVVSYQWRSKIDEQFNADGEAVLRRVSDWDSAVQSAETGRDLVHSFTVKTEAGEQTVSLESALKTLKGSSQAEPLKTAIQAARRIELREAELTEMESYRDQYEAHVQGMRDRNEAPEPELVESEFPWLREKGVKQVVVGDVEIPKNADPTNKRDWPLAPVVARHYKEWWYRVKAGMIPPNYDRISDLQGMIHRDRVKLAAAMDLAKKHEAEIQTKTVPAAAEKPEKPKLAKVVRKPKPKRSRTDESFSALLDLLGELEESPAVAAMKF